MTRRNNDEFDIINLDETDTIPSSEIRNRLDADYGNEYGEEYGDEYGEEYAENSEAYGDDYADESGEYVEENYSQDYGSDYTDDSVAGDAYEPAQVDDMLDGRTGMIQLNEEGIWSGGPQNRLNPDTKKNLAKVRQLVKEGRVLEAQALGFETMSGMGFNERVYQTAGDFKIDFYACYPRQARCFEFFRLSGSWNLE